MSSICGKSPTPAHRRYVVRTMAFMSGYVALCIAWIFGAFDAIEGRPVAWGLAAAITAPIAGQIWATLALMKDSDEFIRAVTARQFILATGLTLALATLWGFGESLEVAPHIPAWMIYPLFWACFGLVSPFVRSSR